MIGRMSGLDRDECPATRRANFPVRDKLCYDNGTVVSGFDDPC